MVDIQCVCERIETALPKIMNFEFPDSMNFGKNLLNAKTKSTDLMEEYASTVLILLYPFRKKEDLLYQGSYVRNLRNKKALLSCYFYLLENIQHIRNCTHAPKFDDELSRTTKEYIPMEDDEVEDDEVDENQEDINKLNFLYNLFGDSEINDIDEVNLFVDQQNFNEASDNLSLKPIQEMGAKQCGLVKYPITSITSTDHNWIETQSEAQTAIQTANSESITDLYNTNYSIGYIRSNLIKLFLQCIHRRIQATTNEQRSTRKRKSRQESPEATGTIESIIYWSQYHQLDHNQTRAFQIIIGCFILTYIYEIEAYSSTYESLQSKNTLLKQKKEIEEMIGENLAKQLLMFLDGPGGSGKSKVIREVLKYAFFFCTNLGTTFSKKNYIGYCCIWCCCYTHQWRHTPQIMFSKQQRIK